MGLAVVALGAPVVALAARPWLQQVGTVAQLWIYPVRSCKGMVMSAAECKLKGLRSGHLRDRYGPVRFLGRDGRPKRHARLPSVADLRALESEACVFSFPMSYFGVLSS